MNGNIPRMDYRQYRAARRLVHECCNYDSGNCLLLEDGEAEKSFCVAGKEITAKLLAEALHSLPDDKREAVLLYYFFEMNDAEIAKLRDVPRSTIQYRRTSSFELLKRYLEERAYDCT